MSKYLLSFLILLAVAFLPSRAQNKIGDLEFEADMLDLGTFPRDSSIRYATFVFRNTGQEKIAFLASKPDCPCVSVTLPRKPIRPGGTGRIAVTYNGKTKRAGSMHHYVYFAVSASPNNFRLQIVGNMTE